jgi:hypothetical protein
LTRVDLGKAEEAIMRIRDMKWKRIPAWPPAWWFSDEEMGEDGILKDVQFLYDQNPACLTVVVTHLDNSMKGIILLEDTANLEILAQKLKKNLGRPLSEIGDLEIDISLSMPQKASNRFDPKPRQI